MKEENMDKSIMLVPILDLETGENKIMKFTKGGAIHRKLQQIAAHKDYFAWKVAYDSMFMRTPKKLRKTISQINHIRNEAKLYTSIFGYAPLIKVKI